MHNELYHHLSEPCSPQPFINSRLHDATACNEISVCDWLCVCVCVCLRVANGTCRHTSSFRLGLSGSWLVMWRHPSLKAKLKCVCVCVLVVGEGVLPRILLMLELCMSGKACRIFLLSSLAQTMKAFIGRLMCGSLLPRPRASRNILESDTLGEPGGGGGKGEEWQTKTH